MKSKTFSGENDAVIIRSVNDWLAGQTGIVIRDTRTRQEPPDPVTGIARTTFEIWYDQDET